MLNHTDSPAVKWQLSAVSPISLFFIVKGCIKMGELCLCTGKCHTAGDLLIPDESAWYAICFWPTYQSMTHVYMNPQVGMSRMHASNKADQGPVTPSQLTHNNVTVWNLSPIDTCKKTLHPPSAFLPSPSSSYGITTKVKSPDHQWQIKT